MPRTIAKLTLVWFTVLGVLVQGVGAFGGGVICVGCANQAASVGGIGLNDAPCEPADECCAGSSIQGDSQDSDATLPITETKGDQDPHGCGCFDVRLNPNSSSLPPQPPVKLVPSLLKQVAPTAMFISESLGSDSLRLTHGAPGRPPTARLLTPSGRQTVLRL